MKKKHYLAIMCLLFSPGLSMDVEASDDDFSLVGIEFYQNPTTPAPKDVPSKTNALAIDPKEPVSPPQGNRRSGGSTQVTTIDSALPRTGSKSQTSPSIFGLVLIGPVGMVHRKRGRHEVK